MKNNYRCYHHFFAAIFLLSIATSANAALVPRLGGQAVYDTDLNITWAANANINGPMDWATANTWATSFVLNGVSGWRLPSSDNCLIYNCSFGSEMGHLFYTELGGFAGANIMISHNANFSLFSNIQPAYYWSGNTYVVTSQAMSFHFGNGGQVPISKSDYYYAFVVHPGDVAAVPIPAAFWLFGSGLIGLLGFAQKRT